MTQHVYDADELAKARATTPDVKESFESGREDDPAMPNIWLPEGVLPGFKEACLDMYWVRWPFTFRGYLLTSTQTFRDIELSILRALAIGLHLSEDYFLQFHAVAENQLRLLRYPR